MKIDELTDEQKKIIAEDPIYFIYEGGSDGTFAHVMFHEDYGSWLPGAIDYASSILNEDDDEQEEKETILSFKNCRHTNPLE